MVHLGKVATTKDIEEKNKGLPDIEGLDLGPVGQNDFTASVYGSRYAAMDLPKYEMPDDEMPKEVAYRMIK